VSFTWLTISSSNEHLPHSMPMKTFQQLLKVSVLVDCPLRHAALFNPLQLQKITISANSVQATVDTIIAVSLCIMLHKSRTGFRQYMILLSLLISSSISATGQMSLSTNWLVVLLVRKIDMFILTSL
jgi:hypothetical protein